jgi:hypothetical protein
VGVLLDELIKSRKGFGMFLDTKMTFLFHIEVVISKSVPLFGFNSVLKGFTDPCCTFCLSD